MRNAYILWPILALFGISRILAQEIETLRAVEYAKIGDRSLHLEITLPKTRPSKPMPVVLWIHGGGWGYGSVEGNRYEGNPAQYLVSRGYFTASIEYRLCTEPGAIWPTQIEDCKTAIRWLRLHASDYGIDPKRIGVWGQSAGANIALSLATMDENAGLSADPEGTSSKVQAIVDYSGPTDFTIGRLFYADPLSALLGGRNMLKDDEKLRTTSPITWVRSNTPPCLIVHGDCDLTVHYAESIKFKKALENAGVPVEMITVRGGGHAWFKELPGGPTPAPNDSTLKEAVFAFFEKHLRATSP